MDPTAFEVLVIKSGQQIYGLKVKTVREIRGWTAPTPLPHSPPYIAGIINLRGLVLPIVDLSQRLGFPASEPTPRHAIVVVDAGKSAVGILVDGVSEIVSVDPSSIQATPEIGALEVQTFVSGVLLNEGRMIALLDLDAILPAAADLTAA